MGGCSQHQFIARMDLKAQGLCAWPTSMSEKAKPARSATHPSQRHKHMGAEQSHSVEPINSRQGGGMQSSYCTPTLQIHCTVFPSLIWKIHTAWYCTSYFTAMHHDVFQWNNRHACSLRARQKCFQIITIHFLYKEDRE